jgi:cytochrome c oxidase subunit II
MAAQTQASGPDTGQREPGHGLRIFAFVIVVAVVADLLIWFVLGPHLPPGTMTNSARENQRAIKLMAVMSAPVVVLVVVYFTYAMIVWRHKEGDDEDGPPIHGNTRLQAIWIAGTTVVVLALAVYGTAALWTANGAGAGEGPAPIFNPPGAKLTVAQQTAPWTPGQVLVVQVIAQQWRFTYRYPQLGGFETTELVIPVGQEVQFNVTSLDVIHSFWAYQLGVKADANPGVNNVTYTKADQTGTFTVRCAELCGLWHGAMFDYGKVLTVPQFQSWVSATSAQLAGVTSILNRCAPYATTYDPTVFKSSCLGSVLAKLGLTGAGGGYYGSGDPAQP